MPLSLANVHSVMQMPQLRNNRYCSQHPTRIGQSTRLSFICDSQDERAYYILQMCRICNKKLSMDLRAQVWRSTDDASASSRKRDISDHVHRQTANRRTSSRHDDCLTLGSSICLLCHIRRRRQISLRRCHQRCYANDHLAKPNYNGLGVGFTYTPSVSCFCLLCSSWAMSSMEVCDVLMIGSERVGDTMGIAWTRTVLVHLQL